MGNKKRNHNQASTVLDQEQSNKSRPPMYAVYLVNDDYTPMDFVVEVLKRFFFIQHEVAVQVMLQVHHGGQAVCGLFTRDIAETKVHQVRDYAGLHQYPLLCRMREN